MHSWLSFWGLGEGYYFNEIIPAIFKFDDKLICRSSKSSTSTWAPPSRMRFWRSCLSRSRPVPVSAPVSRPSSLSATTTVTWASASSAQRKLPLLSAVPSSLPNSPSCPSDVGSGVTRLVDPTPCPARSPVRNHIFSLCLVYFCSYKVVFVKNHIIFLNLILRMQSWWIALLIIQFPGKCGSVWVRLIPAPRGTGIVSAPVPKKLLMMAGIEDCYTSAKGCTGTLGNFGKVLAFLD